jgi:hypothetical protein
MREIMKLEYGALVEDKNNKALGNIDRIVLDTWSGEQRKYVVRRGAPQTDIFFSPEHVDKVTKGKVKLNLTIDELEQE